MKKEQFVSEMTTRFEHDIWRVEVRQDTNGQTNIEYGSRGGWNVQTESLSADEFFDLMKTFRKVEKFLEGEKESFYNKLLDHE